MDINILKTFMEIYRTSHFGKAADNLCVTQSTVSARIRQLEEDLGVKLFSRDRNNIRLTPSGQRFLKHAESILTAWNRAKFDVNAADEKKLPLVVSALPSIWDIYLCRWLQKVRTHYPNLLLIAEANSAEMIIRQLSDYTIDMGFTYDIPNTSGLAVSESLSFELIMVSSHAGIGLEDALKTDYVYVDWGTSFSSQHARHFPEAGTPDIRIGPGRVARDYLRKIGGSAYLPEPMVRIDLQKERLYRVKDAPAINRKSFVMYRENSGQRELLENLLSLNKSRR